MSRPTWRLEAKECEMLSDYIAYAGEEGKGVTFVPNNDGSLLVHADDTENPMIVFGPEQVRTVRPLRP